MSLRRVASWTAAALVVAAASMAIRDRLHARQQEALRLERDSIELLAEQAERERHPWAGVYVAMHDIYIGKTLLVAPDGRFAAASFEQYQPEYTGYALGRAGFSAPMLSLAAGAQSKGAYRSSFKESYRLVRWGGIRCLVASGEEVRLLECAAAECPDFHPLCTRGVIYGQPDIPKELAGKQRMPPLSSVPGFLAYQHVRLRPDAGRK